MFWPLVSLWYFGSAFVLRLGRFPVCWRVANVTPIPKGQLISSSVANYRPISLTSILSEVFERLVSVRLGGLWKKKRKKKVYSN